MRKYADSPAKSRPDPPLVSTKREIVDDGQNRDDKNIDDEMPDKIEFILDHFFRDGEFFFLCRHDYLLFPYINLFKAME